MKKQTFEGYLFITSGCEHGPTIMRWNDEKWSQEDYDVLTKASWCNNNFSYAYQHDGKEGMNFYKEERNKPWAEEIAPDFTPGKRYRITVEELEEQHD